MRHLLTLNQNWSTYTHKHTVLTFDSILVQQSTGTGSQGTERKEIEGGEKGHKEFITVDIK